MRWRALREVYEHWRSGDAAQRPWAHTWRTRLPLLAEAVVGCTITAVREVEGAWDMCGSHALNLCLRTPDGHAVSLHLDASDALGGPDARTPPENSDADWLDQQAALGVALGVSLYDARMDPACRDGPPPEGWDEDGFLEVVVPSVEPWWDDATDAAVERVIAAARTGPPDDGNA